MNTYDLMQLPALARTTLGGEVRKLNEAGAELTALQYVLGGDRFAQDLVPLSLVFLLHRMYGSNVETLEEQLRRLTSMSALFVRLYGDGPISVLRAPARINILGEHIDYVSYLPTASLPFGSREHDMLILYRGSASDSVRGASTLDAYPPFYFTVSDGPPVSTSSNAEADWLSYLYEHPAKSHHWSNYVKGAVFFTRINCGEPVLCGFDFVVDSSIPAGGGASSSSALVVLAGAVMRLVNNISYGSMELARDSSKAEWYVGTRGGAMDHITICLAKRDHAVLISYLAQQARHVALPGKQFRWITFFSQPADKGQDVMIEYNERAAVSRIVIPALIEGWKAKQPERYAKWLSALRSLEMGAPGALDEIETLLQELPLTLTLTELGQDYPEAFAACVRSFPMLVAERAERPLQLQARALHHIGEVRRVKTSEKILEKLSNPPSGSDVEQEVDAVMRLLGALLDQSHASLRDLYQVSTPEVERLIGIIRASPGVYGAHLMGGGFGGNVLALVTQENVQSLITRVQAEYYEPQNRQGVHEGSVMISTPGEGLAPIDVELVWREAIEEFNAAGPEATKYRAGVNALLDGISPQESHDAVWPVIVAAGKGTRSLASGLAIPKPLAPILGTPAILHVLHNVRLAFGETRKPIVIVSPETESEVWSVINEDVTFVVQPQALGTADAVLCAQEQMQGFPGRALVIWGTQPVIQPNTMRRSLELAALFPAHEIVVPTTYKPRPYAPLLRDERGRVQTARETHLEKSAQLDFGETNIGMFMLKSEAMFQALIELKQHYWNETDQRYESPGGELGLPNGLINYFAARTPGVLACPIADSREEQGIKSLEDVARCEQFISELTEL
ncbi:MAG TPA: NTP transferase domain-containing protein [Pyrinomonadaceae bacterium]|nr:NTP transferase domain-containing protein [Pyrinomonadaceae bacterium]